MTPRLSVVSGPHAGEVIAIATGKFLIGREQDCHIRPDSEFISRHHCVLLLDEFTLRIRDLGSKNGTFVNGQRLTGGERILAHGDMIAVGEMMCYVELETPALPLKREADSPSLHGTGVFDGETLQADVHPIAPRVHTTPTPPAGVPVAATEAAVGSDDEISAVSGS